MKKLSFWSVSLTFIGIALLIVGCAVGGISEPTIRTANFQNQSFERAFSAAVKAMNDVGRVTVADKENKFVNGVANSGVELSVVLEELSMGGVNLTVKGRVPTGLAYMGGINEPDDFLKAYQKY